MATALSKRIRRQINQAVFTGRGTSNIAAPKRQKRQQIRKALRALKKKSWEL